MTDRLRAILNVNRNLIIRWKIAPRRFRTSIVAGQQSEARVIPIALTRPASMEFASSRGTDGPVGTAPYRRFTLARAIAEAAILNPYALNPRCRRAAGISALGSMIDGVFVS